jgi:aryl-alcohol dehydrogenase-like predicted oxidoreductase
MAQPQSIARRPLGSTGLEVSSLGFGSWAAGGDGYLFSVGRQDDDDTIEAVLAAAERGVNWIDTAAIYGLGHSEEVIGRAVRTLPVNDRPMLMTKCGLVPTSDPNSMPVRDLRPESIRSECVQSLARLGVDHLDVYLFHWPDLIGTPLRDSWEAMNDLVVEGLVRFAGLSNFSIREMEECDQIAPVSVVQPPLSLLRRWSLRDVVPWCHARERGVLAYSPLQSGILTGGLTRERAGRMAQDWRGQSPELHEPLLSECLDLQPILVEMAAKYDVFPGAIAIAWALAQPGVDGVVIGARTLSYVEPTLRAAEVSLEPSDIERLEHATAAFEARNPVDPV